MREFLLLATGLLAGAPGPSPAAEGHDGDAAVESETLDTITAVGTRTERAISDVAASVTVLTGEDIDREIVRDIADLVRYEPGVTVSGTGDRFGLSGFSIRGIGGNRVLTLVDGVRVPDEFSFGPFLSARRDFVDVESLERAEIARGPISSLYGSDALGGVVAFTTLGPADYVDADDGFYGAVKGGWSGADDSAVGSVTLAAGNGRFAGLLSYSASSGEETETAGSIGGTGPQRELADPQDVDTDNLVGKLSWLPAEGHELTLSVDDYRNETSTQILSDYGTVTSGTTTDRRDADDTRDRTRWSLSYAYAGEALLADDVTATLYRQQSVSLQLMDEDRTTAGGEPQTRVRDSKFEQTIDGAFVQFGKTVESASMSHYLIFGVDYYETASESLRDGGTFAADGSPVFEFSPLPTRDFPATEVEQLGVFLQDEIALLGGRLLVSPGVRYDSFEADAESDAIYENGNPGQPAPEDYDDSEVTARLGVVWHLDDTWSVYGRYSEGFRAPPYDDVNVGFTNFIGGYKTISNPDLESERSDGYELGLRFGAGANTVQLAVYTNEYENFIESLAIAPGFLPSGIDPADGLLTFQSINREAVKISGAELSGALDLATVADWMRGFNLRVAVAYADGEDEETGAPIDSVEPLTGVVGLLYADASDRWGAELVLTAVDARESGDLAEDSLRRPTPGYGVLDLLANYSFTDNVHLYGGLFNLTDKAYIRWADTAAIGGDAPARFTQPGFNAGLTVRVEF